VVFPVLLVLGFGLVCGFGRGWGGGGGRGGGGVVWFAHIGGFVAGMGLFKVFSLMRR